MNWVDGAIVIALVLFTLEGFRKSFIAETFNFLSFLLALVLSLRFYNLPAPLLESWFNLPHSLNNVIGFVLIWFLAETVFLGVIHLIFKPSRVSQKIDQTLAHFSVIPSFFRGLIFISIILVTLGTFPVQPRIKQTILQSKLGSVILVKTQQFEGPLKSVFGGLSNQSLTFFTVEPEAKESIDLGFKNEDFKEGEDLEMQMISLVNQERTSRGLDALSYNPTLKQAALYHSGDMFKRGYFSHYSPEGEDVGKRAEKFNIDYLTIGENLAYAPTLELAHLGLMNSPGHRANILHLDYKQVGIGILDGGIYGLMVTQVFSN